MKFVCIGRNYLEHARELNNPLPKQAVFFLKPESSLLQKNHPFFIPDFSNEVHYEAEVVLKINRNGKHIEERFAHKYFDEVTIGIDFTARDLQTIAKSKGLPWEIAKAFDQSAAVGKFVPLTTLKNPEDISFRLLVNGETRQIGKTSEMIFSFRQIISYVSKFMTLKMGDLIFTGTPAGVGPVRTNDILEGYIENQKLLDVTIK